MKLIDIKPTIFESSDEDVFANPELPESAPELLKVLRRKLAGMRDVCRQLNDTEYLLDSLVGAQDYWAVPEKQRTADCKSGKAFEAEGKYIPNTPGNQAIVKKINDQEERARRLADSNDMLQTKIKRLLKLEAIRHTTLRQKGKTAAQIPESKVPEKISTGKSKFGNPYFAGTGRRYAGDAAFFPFSTPMLIMYHELDEILTSNGLEGFTTLYSSVPGYINFVVIGARGKFLWRKYDMGGGSGQNWAYINGDKIKTSTFLEEARSNSTDFNNWIAALK